MTNNIIYEKNILNWIIWLTAEHLPKDMLQILVVFYLVWNLLETVYIAQGLFEAIHRSSK